MIKTDVAIVGGGIAGLSLAMELEQLGIEYELFEATESPGGLCGSWSDKNYCWHDYGPHIFHNEDGFDWFKNLLPGAKLLSRNDDIVLFNGDIVNYPVQTSCDMQIAPNPSIDIHSYRDYCHHHYGDELTSLFFEPWNEKLYGTPLSNIDVSVTSRTPVTGQAAGYYMYPESGGFNELPETMFECLSDDRAHFCSPVTYIDFCKKYLLGNIHCQYKTLIWAAPIRTLLQLSGIDIKFSSVNLCLITIPVKEGYLPGLARYITENILPHRVSYEAILKDNGSQFAQLELNSAHMDWLDWNISEESTEFIIPDAYIVPTIAWIEEQQRLLEGFNEYGIVLHGKAGTGIHKNIWPIVQDSKKLAKAILTYGC